MQSVTIPGLKYSGTKQQSLSVKITPKLATEWLESHNENNRRVTKNHVGYLATQMKKGHWDSNSKNSLGFSHEGQLLDGQHRLRAIIKSQTSIVMNVVVNMEPESQRHMDMGRPRSVSDRTGRSTDVEAVLSFMHHHKTERARPLLTRSGTSRLTIEDSDRLYKKFKKRVNNVCKYKGNPRVLRWVNTAPMRAGLMGLGAEISWCDEFMQSFHQGLSLSVGDPAYALREWVFQNAKEKGTSAFMVYLAAKQAATAYLDDERLPRITAVDDFVKDIKKNEYNDVNDHVKELRKAADRNDKRVKRTTHTQGKATRAQTQAKGNIRLA